jgi:hypothetical protein
MYINSIINLYIGIRICHVVRLQCIGELPGMDYILYHIIYTYNIYVWSCTLYACVNRCILSIFANAFSYIFIYTYTYIYTYIYIYNTGDAPTRMLHARMLKSISDFLESKDVKALRDSKRFNRNEWMIESTSSLPTVGDTLLNLPRMPEVGSIFILFYFSPTYFKFIKLIGFRLNPLFLLARQPV